ncbi:MAG TPA: hypothetical protein VHW91_01640 [Candidatus Dormibacteraeota bacterium]|jgi:hypothetical protein|nr:hypothetical protein [Candidatus Dormibacteraeota bacterium]
MGNVIPWSQIHPSIKTEEPFIAVVIVDPQRQICVSEVVDFERDALDDANQVTGELVAAAQGAAARVGAGYRLRRQGEGLKEAPPKKAVLRVLRGGLGKRR